MAQQPDDSGGKSWERPWTTEEMRKNAENWTLAADAGLLKHLQQFSQVVLSHTHSTEKALDSLLENLNTTNTNINNVTNTFLCLANTQFLESRVYDDDVESPQDVPATNSNQESIDGDVMTKVKSALSVGINLLDTMFDQVDPNTSGVETDIIAGIKNRSPKNPYISRPLPHLIGSPAFMADDNLGLVPSEKENDRIAAKAPAIDDLSMYSDESILTTSVKRNLDDDSSNTSFCLGEDTPVQIMKHSRDEVSVTCPENDAVPEAKSFADELAAKLGGVISTKVSVLSQAEQSYDEPVPQAPPPRNKDDMFGVPHSDDEDDALFSSRSGMFSGGRGLFDDVDDVNDSGEVAKATQPPPMSKPPLPSKPAIDSDLFGSNSADEENDDLFAVPAKKPPTSKKPEAQPKPLSIGDVISQAARRNVAAPVPTRGEGDRLERPTGTVSIVPETVPPPIAEKKVPAGGRSMFGSAGLAIPKEALRRRPSSSSSEGSDDNGKNTKTISNSGGGLFSPVSADEDDLFQSPAPPSNPVQSTLPKPKTDVKEPAAAARSPVEDDLIVTPKSSTDNSLFKSVESAPKTNSSLGLFDAEGSSDEDNLFNQRPLAKQSFFSNIPPPLTKSEERSKKISLFDDSDSGDDEFLFSSASSAGSRRSQASVDIFNPNVPVPTDKKPLRKGLFDEDNLFSSQLDGPDVDIFRGVGNDSGLGTANSAAAVSTSGTTIAATVASVSTANVTSVQPTVTTRVNSSRPAVATKPTTVIPAVLPSNSSAVAASATTISSPAVIAGASTQPPQFKPSPIGGSLFDDDDDLFSVASKPPPVLKRPGKEVPPVNKFIAAATEDLFSGLTENTKDSLATSDDLFGGDDLFPDDKLPEKIISSMLDNKSKVPVDDLFGVDDGDGDIFISKKSTLTISDSIVDTKSEIIADDSKTGPSIVKPDSITEMKTDPSTLDLKPTPPRTLDIRNTTDPSLVSSFDDEDESEDLFKPLPTDSKPDEAEKPPDNCGIETVPDASQQEVPQIIDQSTSVPIPPENPPKPVPAVRKSSIPTFEEKEAKVDKKRPPEIQPKPSPRLSPAKDDEKTSSTDLSNAPAVEPAPVKARTPLAGIGLNINPLALLPGAQLPSKKTPGEEPVGFDQPMENSSTLRSAQKERVRGNKRRPPSRRARQEAAKNVDHTGIEIISPSSVLSPSTDEDDLFGVPQDLPPDNGPNLFDRAPILSPAETIAENVTSVTDDVDSVKTVDDPLLKLRTETSSETDTDVDVTEDHSSLFAFVKKKPKEPQPEFLFSQTPTLPTKDDDIKVKSDLTDEDIEDDLFKPSSSAKKITDFGSGGKSWKLSDDDDDDDLFTTKVSSSKSIVSSSKELPKEIFDDEAKTALKNESAGATKSETRKGLLPQLAAKKTEKSLFDDDDDLDDDDLFSTTSSKPLPVPVSKGVNQAQKNTEHLSLFKDDLFDDPLSGR